VAGHRKIADCCRAEELDPLAYGSASHIMRGKPLGVVLEVPLGDLNEGHLRRRSVGDAAVQADEFYQPHLRFLKI
jgi:hypothetical protein